jgi:hypothetical protein
MKKTSKILLVLGVLLISATLVSATLLTYFGKVTTTMDVQQSVQVGDQQGWYNWNQPITRELGNVVHCTDYCYKLLLRNQACKDATVSFTDTATQYPGANADGVTYCHHVFGDTQTIQLIQKQVDFGQSPWLPLVDGMKVDLTFNTCGNTFNWNIVPSANLEGYTLIYYANYPQYWTEGPVTVLGSGSSGTYDGPTMPFVNDENAKLPISRVGETYNHQYGAKFWLIPTEALIQTPLGYDVNWGMASQFLFETDLGFYLDCDNWSPVCLPHVYPIFETSTLKAGQTYCWISCYHVDFNIMPGHYAFRTIVNAAEILPQV